MNRSYWRGKGLRQQKSIKGGGREVPFEKKTLGGDLTPRISEKQGRNQMPERDGEGKQTRGKPKTLDIEKSISY